jgi:hypothetical protein
MWATLGKEREEEARQWPCHRTWRCCIGASTIRCDFGTGMDGAKGIWVLIYLCDMCLEMLYFLICEEILNLGLVKYTVLLPVCFLYVSAVFFSCIVPVKYTGLLPVYLYMPNM